MTTAPHAPAAGRPAPASARAMALLAAGIPLTLLIDLAYPRPEDAVLDDEPPVTPTSRTEL